MNQKSYYEYYVYGLNYHQHPPVIQGNALVRVMSPSSCNHKVIEKVTSQSTIANPNQGCPNTIQTGYPTTTKRN